MARITFSVENHPNGSGYTVAARDGKGALVDWCGNWPRKAQAKLVLNWTKRVLKLAAQVRS